LHSKHAATIILHAEYEEAESMESDDESEYACSDQDANDNVIEETPDG